MPVCTEVVPPEVRFSDGVRVACHLFPTSDIETVSRGAAAPVAAPTASADAAGSAGAGTAGGAAPA
jgi:hypothetical protein